MKTRLAPFLLAALLGLAAGNRVCAADATWTPTQQEVAARVRAWEVAALAGDADAIMKLTAPGFMGWDLAKPAPVDRTAYRREGVAFFAQFKVLACALPVTAIQIDGETAAAHGRYVETVQDATGARMKLQGSWTASLRRRDNQWLFLSLSTLADPPTNNEAAITAEVEKTMAAFEAAVEKVDLGAVLALAADAPEFRYVMPDGAVTDFAGWKQGHIDYFATVAAHRLTETSHQITVLAPDTAQVTWLGTMDIVPKDGPAQRVDPFAATFLFRRLGDTWKMVYQHESGPPPQPVAAVVTPAGAEAELRRADAELVTAANARDLEGWLACFDEDATLLPPDAPRVAGKAAIRPAAAALMQCPDFAVAHTITAIDVLAGSTSAWVTYDFTFTANGEDGEPITEKGTDTTLYRKSPGGRWRVLVDIWDVATASTP